MTDLIDKFKKENKERAEEAQSMVQKIIDQLDPEHIKNLDMLQFLLEKFVVEIKNLKKL